MFTCQCLILKKAGYYWYLIQCHFKQDKIIELWHCHLKNTILNMPNVANLYP